MLFPVETAESWAEKYGLKIVSGKCSSCGIDLVSNIPFAHGDWRGLRSEPHSCGEIFTLSTAININPNSNINTLIVPSDDPIF